MEEYRCYAGTTPRRRCTHVHTSVKDKLRPLLLTPPFAEGLNPGPFATLSTTQTLSHMWLCLMHIQIILQTAHLLPGEASTYPQTRKSSLETSQKVIYFKKIKKIWFIFVWINVKILRGFFLAIKQAIRLVGLVRKLMEYGHPVFDMLNSSLMVALFLHIKILWIATLERSVKKECGFIILSSSNISIPSTKRSKRSILSMVTIHCLFVTSTMMSIRNIWTST